MARGRGRGASSTSARGKRARAASPELDNYTEPPPKKVRGAAQPKPPLEPRQPSARATRGIPAEKPGFEKTVPRTNRPHTEVQAEKDNRAAEALARQEELAAAKARVAALSAEVDQAAADDEANTINSLADLPEDDDTVLEFTDTDFQRIEEDDDYESVGEYAPKPKSKPAAKVPRAKKPKKGDTKAEMEELTRALKAKGVGGKQKSVQNSDAAAASKRAGLSTRYLATTGKAVKAGASPGKFEYGSLTEEDAESTRPDLTGAEATIQIDLDSDGDDTPIRLPAAVPRKVPQARATSKVTASKVKAEPKIPALAVGLTNKKKKRVKLEAESSVSGFTPASAGDVNGLPALVGPTWETLALPALYSALYRSSDPMIFATKGETAVSEGVALKAIRDKIDKIYPGNTLPTFLWNDVLLSWAVSRVREHRTLVIQTCLSVIDAFFKTEEYLGKPAAIMKYAKYALRVDGPAFWKIPTPESCPRDPKAPEYIKPQGYMESPMMIQIASVFLKNGELTLPTERDDASYDASGLPVGLFGLMAGGLERGFKLYSQTSRREESVPVFKAKTHNTAIRVYVSNIERFTISRWTSLLTALGPTTVITTAPEVIDDELDGCREYAYVASSP
ncbi:hypothetical protein B0H10DRAFT_2223807 [Mycena sp. CBHHK59/15]|nr:hypothetical protein B0H10DRAFT_2223807 [Mycena sp. CBHHK59/15]